MSLPPLPKAHIKRDAYIYDSLGEIVDTAPPLLGYTPKQMHEYGALCRKMALEEAAKAIESTRLTHLPTAKQYEYASLLSAYATYFRELLK